MAERRHRCLAPALALLLAGPAVRAADGLPPITDADRAAAFPAIPGEHVHAHMAEDPLTAMGLMERLEWRGRTGDDAILWDATGWVGWNMNRLWVRAEGERESGRAGENTLEAFWGRPLARWWDLLVGVRRDSGPGTSRSYVALGVEGLAPQWFHVEATGYLGEGGQFGVGVESTYDWNLTQRLVLGLRTEVEAWGEDDTAAGIGSGLSAAAVGLRLRYEIRREWAPYLGLEWEGVFGDTADLRRASGEDRRETACVLGLRLAF